MNDIGIETEWRVIEGSPEEGVPSNLLGECNFRCFLSREHSFICRERGKCTTAAAFALA
jgi:hypothetical protein